MLSFGEITCTCARPDSLAASLSSQGWGSGEPGLHACASPIQTPIQGPETGDGALYLRFALPTSGALLYFCWISSLKALRPSRIVGICAVRNFSAFLCEASDGSLAVNLTS